MAKFRKQFLDFEAKSQNLPLRFNLRWEDRQPIFFEDTGSHNFDRHYVYHTAWATRKVREINPNLHVDFSSSLYFCSLLSAFIPTTFYDLHPPRLKLDNLTIGSADLTSLKIADASFQSVSCMHVVEHIGLGRYGDEIDPGGDLKAIHELQRIVAPGGSLLLVVPVGKPKVEFNAQRIYAFDQIIEVFSEMRLVEFALVPDDKSLSLILHAEPALVKQQEFGCGCFWFAKPITNNSFVNKSI